MSTRTLTIEYVNNDTNDTTDCATFTLNSYDTVNTFVDSSGHFHVMVGGKLVFICAKLIAFSDQTDDE